LTTAEYLRPANTHSTTVTSEMDRLSLANDAVRVTSVTSEMGQATTSLFSSPKTEMTEMLPAEYVRDIPQTLLVRHSSPNLSVLGRHHDVLHTAKESMGLNAMTPLALDMYASAAQLPLPDMLDQWNEGPLNVTNTSSGGDLLGHIHDLHEHSVDPPLYWNSVFDNTESAHFGQITRSTSNLHKQRALSLGSSLSALELGLVFGHSLTGADAASGLRSPVKRERLVTQDAVGKERITKRESSADVNRRILPSEEDHVHKDRGQRETQRERDIDTDNEDDDIDDDEEEEEESQLPSDDSNGVRRGTVRHLSQESSQVTHFDRTGRKKELVNNTPYGQVYGGYCCLTPSDLPPMQQYARKLDSRVALLRSREQTRQLRKLLADHRAIEEYTHRAIEVSNGSLSG